MDDIPKVENIDSLVSVIEATKDKKSTNYLLNLITLERNRNLIGSVYLGKYLSEIDTLSHKKNIEFGKAFYLLMKSKELLKTNIGNLAEAEKYVNKSLIHFTKTHDTTATISAYTALSRIHLRLQIMINKNKFLDNTQNNYKSQSENYFIKANEYITKAENLANLNNNIENQLMVTLAKMNNKFEILPTLEYYDTAKTICKNCISKIENEPKLRFLLSSFYNYYGNAYLAQDSNSKGIEYHLKALTNIANKESKEHSMVNSNIGNEYLEMGLPQKGLPYLLNAYGFDTSHENYPRTGSLNYLYGLADIYEIQKNYKTALYYYQEILKVKNEMDEKSKEIDFLQNESEKKIKQKEIKEVILKNKNKISMLLLWSSLIFISILSFFTYRIVRSRKKLALAYDEIKVLQVSRDKFLTIVAHDLRSPIQSYQNLADTISFLIKKEKFEDLHKISKRIDETGIQIDLMLTNLLSFSLSEQNQLIYKKEEVNIEQLFQEIMPLYLQMATLKKINLHQAFQFDKILFDSNKNYLSIVIRNLLDNAIKNATIESDINIESHLNDSIFSFTISNLSNMNEKQISIIQTFFNSDKSFQPSENGLGIGMILIKEFLQKMNGKIHLNYQNNKAEFAVEIPIA